MTGSQNRTTSRFLADKRGGIAVMGAIVMPVMIGFAALATEYGHALTLQAENQRVSDLASYAGALAYGQAKSEDTMRAAVLNIAILHSIPASDVAVSLIASPRTAGAKAVNVDIRTAKPIYLAKVLGAKDLTIAVSSSAEIGGGTDGAGCIIALDPNGVGVEMSGGTVLNAPKCTVASNAAVKSPCGTKIIAKNVTYGSSSAPDQPDWCKTIQKPDGSPAAITKATTPDPLAENKAVLAAVDRFSVVAKQRAPSAPTGGGGQDLDFNPWDNGKRMKLTTVLASQGCTGAFNNNLWTVTCTSRSMKFGDFLIESGLTVNFNVNGRSDTSYSFASIKSQGGGNYRFGPGTYLVPGGITMGGSEVTFGAGTFKVGAGPCGFSICGGNSGTMRFDGPSIFELPSGILVEGGNKAYIGAGVGNSYQLGPSNTNDAQSIRVNSGSLVLAAALDGGFQATGRIWSGGGTCLALPASAEHDIKGSIDVSGALILGAGNYTIDGFLALGQNYGGSADCNGKGTVSLLAEDVTLVLSGKETATSWACSGAAFCASSGYNNMILRSPASGDLAQIAVIGPTKIKAGATLTSGAGGGKISGAFYFPKGPIQLSGGASASGQTTCLMLIGTEIKVSGGTAAASECTKIGGGAGGAGKIAKLVR